METKFRAFQLDTDGSLFSFYKPGFYTLIEARLPKGGLEVLKNDLKIHGLSRINTLHVTSWDNDHCNYDDLIQILNHLRPAAIEIPGYSPDTETGELCEKTIHGYDAIHEMYKPNVIRVNKSYIAGLSAASFKETVDVAYHSKENADKKNDMSLIKLFRSNGFNVISLGDCECGELAQDLMTRSIFSSEIDVLILPHHGADNGFITADFLSAVKPKIAISSSNFGNQYGHPKHTIRDLLYEHNIPIYTTKTGDVFIVHKKGERESEVYNLISDNDKVSSTKKFSPKRYAA